MPHVIVKLWPGRTEAQKKQLAERITRDIIEVLQCGDDAVSVAMQEVASSDWKEKVYAPDILGKPKEIYKMPGYEM